MTVLVLLFREAALKAKPLQAASAYLVLTFPVAILWHITLFRSIYEELGYFGREPSFVLGFLAIATQGLVLGYLFDWLASRCVSRPSVIRFTALAGLFLWSSHVLAFAAKQETGSVPAFVAIETFYLALQFALFGLALSWIYRDSSRD